MAKPLIIILVPVPVQIRIIIRISYNYPDCMRRVLVALMPMAGTWPEAICGLTV